MLLSVIIVNYNTKNLLEDCILSLSSYPAGGEMEIIVVDNNSCDESQDFLANHPSPLIKPILLKENLGFSKANNIGISASSGDYVLILNPDTKIVDTTLNSCLEVIKNDSSIGVLGCRVLLEDGSLDLACRRSFPTLSNSFFRFSGLSKLFKNSKTFSKYNLTYLSETQSYEVDSIVGAFMLLPRKVLNKVGLFDERFFMYAEDIDLCYRIKQQGFKVYYFGQATIMHYKRASSKKSTKAKSEFYNSMYLYYQKHHAKNHSKLINKLVHYSIFLIKRLGL